MIPFRVITVLGPESLRNARAMHDFYVEEGIDHVGFNVDESEGEHVSSLRDGTAAFGAFLAEFWALAEASGKIKSIREIDAMREAIFRRPPPGMVPALDSGRGNMMTEPFSILSMDHRGNLATFSPELLGHRNAEYDNFIIGNVHADSFDALPDSPVLGRMRRDIAAGVALCREQCPYFHVCGGGEPVNKLAENGSFISTATDACRMTRMAVADLVISGPHDG
jgi:uncharacterized protein